MIDTVNMFLPFEKVQLIEPRSYVPQFLTRVTEHYPANNEPYITGYLSDNYRVTILKNGMSLKGSLAKYYLKSNFRGLDCKEFQEAIELMSDCLHLPICKSKITRLDIASTIETVYKPIAYQKLLGESRNYKRNIFTNSLYYLNPNKTKCFYDKILEATKNKAYIPESWRGKNALRYELRFEHKIPSLLNVEEITPEIFLHKGLYKKATMYFINGYTSINKINSFNVKNFDMKTPKDITKQFALLGIESLGGQNNALAFIEDMRILGVFKNPEYYSRAKRAINNLCKTPLLTEDSELIKELDSKFENLKETLNL